MDVIGLMLLGVAILSLLPVLFVLYALFVDLRDDQQPSNWDKICAEHFRGAVSGVSVSATDTHRLFSKVCNASSTAYFRVDPLPSRLSDVGHEQATVSEMVLEREPVPEWHTISRGNEYAEVAYCLFTRKGERIVLTHRLWIN